MVMWFVCIIVVITVLSTVVSIPSHFLSLLPTMSYGRSQVTLACLYVHTHDAHTYDTLSCSLPAMSRLHAARFFGKRRVHACTIPIATVSDGTEDQARGAFSCCDERDEAGGCFFRKNLRPNVFFHTFSYFPKFTTVWPGFLVKELGRRTAGCCKSILIDTSKVSYIFLLRFAQGFCMCLSVCLSVWW